MATKKSSKPALSAVPKADTAERANASSALHYAHLELACLGKLLQIASDSDLAELSDDDLFSIGRMVISRAQDVESAANKLEVLETQREAAEAANG